MAQFAIRRALATVPLLLGVLLLTMVLPRFIPGDVVDLMLSSDSYASPERAEQLRVVLGLDRSIPVQYWDFLVGVTRGSLGNSLRTGQPIGPTIGSRFVLSGTVAVLAILLGVLGGVTLGLVTARFRTGLVSIVLKAFSIIGLSIPPFWLGTLLILFASTVLVGLFPTVGSPSAQAGIVERLRFAFLPALSMAIASAAVFSRLAYAALVDVVRQDYIRTARSKGVAESVVFAKHALRNAIIPVVTEVGSQFGRVFGGIVAVEAVFAYPGLGLLALNAISQRDYPMLQGVLLALTVVFVLINLLVDVSYAWIDPRIKIA